MKLLKITLAALLFGSVYSSLKAMNSVYDGYLKALKTRSILVKNVVATNDNRLAALNLIISLDTTIADSGAVSRRAVRKEALLQAANDNDQELFNFYVNHAKPILTNSNMSAYMAMKMTAYDLKDFYKADHAQHQTFFDNNKEALELIVNSEHCQ